jgi:hypothetical protein
VDVYVTADEGATWEPAPADPNASLPLGVDGRSSGPVRGSVTVTLPREGATFGYYLIVKSRAGLGKPPPQRGEPPQVRLELDASKPLAKLYEPQQDPRHPSTLLLSWTAVDRNLAANPVTLEWAEFKDGPWTPIGPAQLPNNLNELAAGAGGERQNVPTGTYVWQVPDKMPAKVYLKLTVRDTAGNVAVAATAESVLIDLVMPEVGNVSVTVAPAR